MTYGYKTLEDGSIVPYPIDTQLPEKVNKNKLSNSDIDVLTILIEQRLSELQNKSDLIQVGLENHCKPEILQNINKKLHTMYFS